jgi:hypothetical protein
MIQGLQTGGSMSRKPRVDRSPEEKWYYPTVILEPRYLDQILGGIRKCGLVAR